MPLQRPRRVFRGSRTAAPEFWANRGMLAGLAGVVLAAVVLLLGLPSNLFGRAAPQSGVVTAEAHQVAVVDGDTLRLHDTVVRLDGVAAPGRGRTCRDGVGTGYDCGAAASAALAALVRDRRVDCRLFGRDRNGLAQGVCEAGGTELNRALVLAGWARSEVPSLAEAEAAARAGRRGLWRDGADPSF